VSAQPYMAFTSDGAVEKSGMRRPFCELFVEELKLRGGI